MSSTPEHPDSEKRAHPLGGIIHTYLGYDPQRFPPPNRPPAGEAASGAFEHMLMYGRQRPLTEEELANAVRIDPSQIAGLGPSLDAIIAMLEERKRRILETYETNAVQREAHDVFHSKAKGMTPPKDVAKAFHREVAAEQIRDLERLWYRVERSDPRFAQQLLQLIERLGEKYEVDQLAAKYDFTGRQSMSVEEALRIKEELEKIDELLEQLREAMENAQIAVIDMDALSEFAEPGDIDRLNELREQVKRYMEEMARRDGLERSGEGYTLSPRAMRIVQSRLLAEIFSELDAARRGRHEGPISGEGAVELPKTRPYEFGDSVAHMDITQTMINAMVRESGGAIDRLTPPESSSAGQGSDAGAASSGAPLRRKGAFNLRSEDIEIHETRNNPKCATAVIMDMSGSMRYGGLYVQCKRMGVALDGLIRKDYPGDFLQFIEMYSFAKPRHVSEVMDLMPRPVTIYDPVVRLRADMSDERITEFDVPPHFTNIQHSLQLARRMLSVQDTPNRQIVLITDGLPTAHFEGSDLFLLYPPDARTEEHTMREARLCQRENITINIFLLPTWSQSHEDVQFAQRMAETTSGRVFFTAGNDLDRFVLWDYVSRRRKIIG